MFKAFAVHCIFTCEGTILVYASREKRTGLNVQLRRTVTVKHEENMDMWLSTELQTKTDQTVQMRRLICVLVGYTCPNVHSLRQMRT